MIKNIYVQDDRIEQLRWSSLSHEGIYFQLYFSFFPLSSAVCPPRLMTEVCCYDTFSPLPLLNRMKLVNHRYALHDRRLVLTDVDVSSLIFAFNSAFLRSLLTTDAVRLKDDGLRMTITWNRTGSLLIVK